MNTYTLIQCVSWPIFLISISLLRTNKNVIKFLAPTLEQHAIIILRSLYVLFRSYVGFNSLIIAICRYCFIVFDQTTASFGIGQARKVLLGASFGIPLLVAILGEATLPMEHMWRALSTAEDAFESPTYELTNSFLPSLVTYGIGLFCMALLGFIFSNIGEGLIYLHIYIYGRR